MSRLNLVGGVLVLLSWAYVVTGPAGVLPRPGSAGLPLPTKRLNDLGAASAFVDAGEWEAACDAAGLPRFPDPNGVEYEPLGRLIEASQRWSETGDGDELGRMGEIAMALELHGPAIDYFAAARKLGTSVERWTYFLGAECQVVGASSAAIEALKRARQLDESYGTTSLRLGALHFELGEFEAADRDYALASTRQPAPAAGWVGRGRVAIAKREFEKALGFLNEALLQTPRDFLAHRLRSQALAGLDRQSEAAEAAKVSNNLTPYRGWLTFDPRLAEAHRVAGTQHSLETALTLALSSGDMAGAARAGEELLLRLPKSAQILSVLARVLANSGNMPRALTLAQQAAELEPENLQALSALADIAMGTGDLEVGATAARAMLSLAPQDARAHQVLGRLYFKQGRLEDCLTELHRAIQLEPRAAVHRLMLVDVLRRNARFLDAELELEALLAFDPANAQALQILRELRAR